MKRLDEQRIKKPEEQTMKRPEEQTPNEFGEASLVGTRRTKLDESEEANLDKIAPLEPKSTSSMPHARSRVRRPARIFPLPALTKSESRSIS